jgi:hypothetical protein
MYSINVLPLIVLFFLDYVVGDWLLFSATWASFQLCHDENKLHRMRWWCPLSTSTTNYQFHWNHISHFLSFTYMSLRELGGGGLRKPHNRGHMGVALCTNKWKCRLREYENVTKLLCINATINLIYQKTYLSYHYIFMT